jgi:hypothetical protein
MTVLSDVCLLIAVGAAVLTTLAMTDVLDLALVLSFIAIILGGRIVGSITISASDGRRSLSSAFDNLLSMI